MFWFENEKRKNCKNDDDNNLGLKSLAIAMNLMYTLQKTQCNMNTQTKNKRKKNHNFKLNILKMFWNQSKN